MNNKFKSKLYNRFAFREEYFGGLFLDYENSNYEIINEKELNFLKKVINKEGVSKKNLGKSDLSNFIKKLTKKGAFQINNSGKILTVDTREITIPGKIPEDFLSAPLKVYDTYTRKCNLNCRHCYAESNNDLTEERRTIKETKKIIKKLYDVGVMEWSFTGGEPLVAPDLFQAIQIAKSYGMKVSLNTNGCIDESMIEKIISSNIDELTVSLEGREKTNDQRRGKGTYKKVIKTLRRINDYNKDNKPKVILNMTIGKDNVDDIEFVTEKAIEYGCDIKFVTLKPAGRADSEFSKNIPSTEEFMKFAKKTQKLREKKKVKRSTTNIFLNHQDLFCPFYSDKSNLPFPFDGSECSAVTTALDILPNGDTVTCSFLMNREEFKGLNIINNSFREVWHHPTLNSFRNAEKQGCPDCKFYQERCRGVCRSTVILGGGKIEDKKLIGEDYCCFKDLIK